MLEALRNANKYLWSSACRIVCEVLGLVKHCRTNQLAAFKGVLCDYRRQKKQDNHFRNLIKMSYEQCIEEQLVPYM